MTWSLKSNVMIVKAIPLIHPAILSTGKQGCGMDQSGKVFSSRPMSSFNDSCFSGGPRMAN